MGEVLKLAKRVKMGLFKLLKGDAVLAEIMWESWLFVQKRGWHDLNSKECQGNEGAFLSLCIKKRGLLRNCVVRFSTLIFFKHVLVSFLLLGVKQKLWCPCQRLIVCVTYIQTLKTILFIKFFLPKRSLISTWFTRRCCGTILNRHLTARVTLHSCVFNHLPMAAIFHPWI